MPRRTIIIASAAGLLLIIILFVAAFPVGWFRENAERRLSQRIGAPVHIGVLTREDALSFDPVIRVENVRIGQPAWAGPGNLATIRILRVRVPLPGLLIGQGTPDVLTASGIRLDLVRGADGRVNWRTTSKDKDRESEGGRTDFTALAVDDTVIRYRDARQKRTFTLSVTSDPARGLTATGNGTVDGAPISLHATGGPMVADRAWPFDARIDGSALAMHAWGTMAAPLRTDAMAFHVTARADDLKRIDRIIEAGLFRTRAVTLSADVRHGDDTWTVNGLTGTVGRSDLSGHVTARKLDGRTRLDGDIRFGHLDFDDLASDESNAKALALEQAEGLRLVPNTRINIRKIRKTDGRIAVRVDHVVGGRRPSSLTGIAAVLTIQNRLLTVAPLRLGLTRGAITGKLVVDQRDGGPEPRVTIALDLTGSSIAALAGGADARIDGQMDGRVRLTGSGSTIREVVGRSNGTIGIVARDGTLPVKIAALIGFDVGRGLLSDDGDRAALRCAIVRLDMKDGTGTFAPLLIDTSSSQTRGTGAISFPGEAIAATLTGAPKRDALLVVPGYVTARGTIRDPHIVVPEQTKSVGNILKAIGRAITGHDEALATDADCAGLGRRALAG